MALEHPSLDAQPDAVECHTLWIGSDLPAWVVNCVRSYLLTGHRVSWWLYHEEERKGDLGRVAEDILSMPNLHIRNANEICLYKRAREFYYHGMGPEGKWAGWAPFSDWFRYEVVCRFGGWWVDADGVSVRQLQGLQAPADVPVIATERHRRDRRSVGAVAVPFPGEHLSVDAAALVGATCENPADYRAWIQTIENAGLDLCLVTNNHFMIPGPGSPMMKELAHEMLVMLEKYAQQVKEKGVAGVQQLDQGGRSSSALPTGLVGMELFQRKVREAIRSANQSQSAKPTILHWSVFNPVEAVEPERMQKILRGTEKLRGEWVRTVHLFRQIRDQWGAQGMPQSFNIITTDERTVPESYRRKASVRQQTSLLENEVYVEVSQTVGRPLLKRPRRLPSGA